MRLRAALTWVGFSLVACSQPPAAQPSREPTPTAGGAGRRAEPPARGLHYPSETPDVTLIYLVSRDNRLIMFDPVELAFHVVGSLRCPEGPFGAAWEPHSMSVDHFSRAWVLYKTGDIMWVNTLDATCRASEWVAGQEGFQHFGMGFVREPDGSDALYISDWRRLAKIDPDTARAHVVGRLPPGEMTPELAGGDAQALYAFYPGAESSFLARLDRRTGDAEARWTLPPLAAQTTAWAAASLSGYLYLFVTSDEDAGSHSRVFRFDPQKGESTLVVPYAPYAIVGAGVGTRPPVIVR